LGKRGERYKNVDFERWHGEFSSRPSKPGREKCQGLMNGGGV